MIDDATISRAAGALLAADLAGKRTGSVIARYRTLARAALEAAARDDVAPPPTPPHRPATPIRYVVVGRGLAEREPIMAAGPLDTEEDAAAVRDLLDRVTTGVYVVLPLHEPMEA